MHVPVGHRKGHYQVHFNSNVKKHSQVICNITGQSIMMTVLCNVALQFS